jgi:hypothetical protein
MLAACLAYFSLLGLTALRISYVMSSDSETFHLLLAKEKCFRTARSWISLVPWDISLITPATELVSVLEH